MPVRRNRRADSALNAARDRTIRGVDIYLVGTEDRVATGRRLRIQESETDRWVGAIDTDLGPMLTFNSSCAYPTGSHWSMLGSGPDQRDEKH